MPYGQAISSVLFALDGLWLGDYVHLFITGALVRLDYFHLLAYDFVRGGLVGVHQMRKSARLVLL
jgi:hypothetical protein